MGDMLNLGCWQWVSMEYHPYEFLEGHICVVAYCNVELAVCILFVVWDLYSYQGPVTASFPSSGSGPFYFTVATIANQVCQFFGVFYPIHYYGSVAFVSWEYYDTVIIP